MVFENPQHEPKDAERAEEKAEQNSGNPRPSVPPPNPPPGPLTRCGCDNDSFKERSYRLSNRQFVVALVTLIILAIYTAIAGFQAYQMRIATQAANKSAAAAKKAADTADDTLKSSKASFQIEQRPYMVTENLQFVVGPLAPGLTSANITFRNIGRTPAIRNRRSIALLKFHPGPKTPGGIAKFIKFLEGSFEDLGHNLDLMAADKNAEKAREDLAPNATTFNTGELKEPLTALDIPGLQKGDLTLFYIGIVRYTDAYNGSYETQFCYFYFGPNAAIWHLCDSHNIVE
jgi:hypothetical protein